MSPFDIAGRGFVAYLYYNHPREFSFLMASMFYLFGAFLVVVSYSDIKNNFMLSYYGQETKGKLISCVKTPYDKEMPSNGSYWAMAVEYRLPDRSRHILKDKLPSYIKNCGRDRKDPGELTRIHYYGDSPPIAFTERKRDALTFSTILMAVIAVIFLIGSGFMTMALRPRRY